MNEATTTLTRPTFQGSPEELHRRLLHQIEELGSGLDVDGALVLRPEIQRKLDGLGRGLWQQLLNDEMRQAYRRFRSSIRTLLIVSDEPWIPWEMIKPYDDQGELIDDEFFAERFELTRWLTGNRPSPGEIAVQAFACLAQGDRLPTATAEGALITSLLHSQKGLRDASPASPGVETLTAVLQAGGIGLLHLAGHGTFDSTLPNEAGLPLTDGSVLRPSDLHGPVQTQLGQDRSLVFLNACRSGRQGWSWTGLGGWADRWVRLCGCGAFIGPQWNPRDSVAFAFARAFYESLAKGETLGTAAKTARQAAHVAAPGDPGWLAYAVYGHPNARLLFSPAARAETPAAAGTLRSSKFFDGTFSPAAVAVETSPEPTPQPAKTATASSNLRIKQTFTDRNRDRFVEESFEYIADFLKALSTGFSNNIPPSRQRFGGSTGTASPRLSTGTARKRAPAGSGFPGALWATSLMQRGIPEATTPTTQF
jgi:hypothetical protein